MRRTHTTKQGYWESHNPDLDSAFSGPNSEMTPRESLGRSFLDLKSFAFLVQKSQPGSEMQFFCNFLFRILIPFLLQIEFQSFLGKEKGDIKVGEFLIKKKTPMSFINA